MKVWLALCIFVILIIIGVVVYHYKQYLPSSISTQQTPVPKALSTEEIQQLKQSKPITEIEVFKEKRRLHLKHHDEIVRDYPMRLGFDPIGHKQFEGDGKTPEGEYRIDWRNPQSAFYKSLHISYPNQADLAYAQQHDQSAGGDIMIHGTVPKDRTSIPSSATYMPQGDWTLGCIAVRNIDMDEIWQLVDNNTKIKIHP